LGHVLGQFIEFIVHNFFSLLVLLCFVRAGGNNLPMYKWPFFAARVLEAPAVSIRINPDASAAAALAIKFTLTPRPPASPRIGISFVHQPQRGQGDACDPDTELPERSTPRDGLGQALGQFIEFVVHVIRFVFVCWSPDFDSIWWEEPTSVPSRVLRATDRHQI
jgi:hypothetical protein